MPIKPELRHHYSREAGWPEIRRAILDRAKKACERCGAPNGGPAPWKRSSTVVLTIAHLDQDPANNELSNLQALCQRCHLNHDRPFNVTKSRATRCDKKDSRRPLLRPA